MTDQELIEGIIKRDRIAIRQFVDQYQEKVIKTAYYFLGNMEDAEDLSQDIFLEIMESIKKFRKEASFSTWVYRITVNKSLNRIRKNKRSAMISHLESLFRPSQERETCHPEIPATNFIPMEEEENRMLLHRAIGSLPENQRISFVLHKFEERSYKEISEIMSISLSSVESLIHRAKMNLQKRLIPNFPEYSKK
jgi:RNA polymerase sigma-70 factor (ECF subfamily)